MNQRDPIPETYDEWRKLKCEWCAKGYPLSQGDTSRHYNPIPGDIFSDRCGNRVECTAGSRDAYEAELVAALKGMTREWRAHNIDGKNNDPIFADTEKLASEWQARYPNKFEAQSRLVSPWEPAKQEKE